MLIIGLTVLVLSAALLGQHAYYAGRLRRYRTLFARNVAGFYRAGSSGVLLEANDALARMCGVNCETDLLGRTLRDFFQDPGELDVLEQAVHRTGVLAQQTVRLKRNDGVVVWVVANAVLVSVPDEEPEIEGSLIEITSQKKAEERVELLVNAVESSRDLISITGLDDCFTFVNQAFLDEYGYRLDEIIGTHVRNIDSGNNDPRVRPSIFEETRRGRWSGELLNRRKDGTEFPIALSTSLIRDARGEALGLIGVATNITERKQREWRVHYEAYHDVLTSLPNRRLFIDRLTVALALAHRHVHSLAVMFIDLDRFSRINDSLGHTIGDELLLAVGSRLGVIVRSGDTLARVGGDEFMLLAPDMHDPGDATRLAIKIIESFNAPFDIDGQELFVTASIGVALHPADGVDAETLMKNADLAMCRAKELGRMRFEFSSPATRTEVALEHLHLENKLRRAIQRFELVPYYQPQICMRTGRIVGTEALLRWRHPERGLLHACEFIHIAEESNLIGEMDERVLREAVEQLQTWHEDVSRELRMAVNISARQFLNSDLPAILRETLARSGIDPQTLEIEITESLAMRDIDQTVRILREVKALGVRVAIDDFGIGHSSLNYLKSFPVDSVKIDRSFIRHLATDPHDAEITSSIIGMAHRLGLNTVAEGVETVEQRMILERSGCDDFQGYLVQVAIPAEEFAAWSASHARGESLTEAGNGYAPASASDSGK